MILDEQRRLGAPAPPAPVAAPPQGNVTATSVGAGSPLGVTPVVPANMQGWVSDMLQGLVYSVPAGGYISGLNPWTGRPPSLADRADANSAYNKFGPLNANAWTQKYGVSDPAANQRAAELYGYLGTLPTRAVGTPALEKLNAQQGLTGALGPSLNERMASAGLTGKYGGPWETPLYHPFTSEEDWRYMHPRG